jgi:hypothetical protein
MTENTSRKTTSGDERSTVATVGTLPHRFVLWLAGQNMFAILAVGFALGFLVDRTRFEAFSGLFYLAGGLLPVVLMTVDTSDGGYDYELSTRQRVTAIVGMLVWSITPMGVITQVLQIGGNFVPYLRYRGRLPNRDRHVPDAELTAPFEGEWTALNGGVTKRSSHSWGLVSQRYAYDFVITDEDGDTHEGDGTALADYYAFGEPICAPADGTVVATEDSLRDYPTPGSLFPEWRTYEITGNYVVIEHDDGEYSMLAHLQEASVAVEPGDELEQGDVVGKCGNSGHSSEPHLHYQLMDRSNFWVAAGLVPQFTNIELSRDDDRRETHGFYEPLNGESDRPYVWAGDRITG